MRVVARACAQCARSLLRLSLTLAITATLQAQAVSTAAGPGGYVSLGGGAAAFASDYSQRTLAGGFVYADVQPNWRYGLELEARTLRLHTSEEVRESNYLAGLRVSMRPVGLSPYVKLLAGDGHIDLPFAYARGDFLALVPGAGVEYNLNDRWIVRALDFEYQLWRNFPYGGSLKPYGVSAGIGLRLNRVPRYPKGARARH